MTPSGGNKTNLTNNPASDDDPAWSPDGKKIAFTSDRGNGLGRDVFVMRADGTKPTNLTNTPRHDYRARLVAGRQADRLRQQPGRQRRGLLDDGHRQEAAPPDAPALGQRRRARLVAGRQADRLHQVPERRRRRLHDERRRLEPDQPVKQRGNTTSPRTGSRCAGGSVGAAGAGVHPRDPPEDRLSNQLRSRPESRSNGGYATVVGARYWLASPRPSRDSSDDTKRRNQLRSKQACGRFGRATVLALAAVLLLAGSWLGTSSGPVEAAFPGKNGLIVFVSNVDHGRQPRGRHRDLHHETGRHGSQATDQERGGRLSPAWSPSGKMIAFASERDGNFEIYTMRADGSDQTNRTNNPAFDAEPAWSPNGKQIAFSSNRDGNNEIYSMQASGANQTNLTNNAANDGAPAWSPDGRRIAYQSNLNGPANEVYAMDPDGANRVNLTNNPAPDFWPAWSPDGTQIAFTSGRDGNFEVYTMGADGSNPTNRTNNSRSDFEPAWSPNGKQIAFTTSRDGNQEIYLMSAAGDDQTNVTVNPSADSSADWQPKPKAKPGRRDQGVDRGPAGPSGPERRTAARAAPPGATRTLRSSDAVRMTTGRRLSARAPVAMARGAAGANPTYIRIGEPCPAACSPSCMSEAPAYRSVARRGDRTKTADSGPCDESFGRFPRPTTNLVPRRGRHMCRPPAGPGAGRPRRVGGRAEAASTNGCTPPSPTRHPSGARRP